MNLFLVLSVVLWYVIEWIKRLLADVPEKVRKAAILMLALVGGIALAVHFKLDAFAFAGEAVGLEPVPPSMLGQVFGGLILASGAGGAHELISALQGGTVYALPLADTGKDKTDQA